MLDDIIYWAEYYLAKRQDHSFRGGWLSDTLFLITLCLLFNLLTLFYCVELYLGWDIIQQIPIISRREFSSWLYASLFFIPVLSLLYYKYFENVVGGRLLRAIAINHLERRLLGKSYFGVIWQEPGGASFSACTSSIIRKILKEPSRLQVSLGQYFGARLLSICKMIVLPLYSSRRYLW